MHLPDKILAPLRVHIELLGDVLQASQQLVRRSVAINSRQGRVGA